MSLICGILSRTDLGLASPEALDAMLAVTKHRARDGLRTFVDPADGIALALGSTATFGQRPDAPAWSEDASLIAAVDGDIYEPESYFQGQLDPLQNSHAAAVAASYEANPETFPAVLDGFFSLFLWDRRAKTLRISSDALGHKLLYYYEDRARGLMVFSTELKGVLAHPAVPRELDERVLPLYLTKGNIPPPYALAKGVRKLSPAECLTLTPTSTDTKRFWQPELESGPDDLDYWSDRLLAELVAAVRRTAGDAGKVAVHLSGGIDSSLLLAAINAVGGIQAQAFTLAFKDKAESLDVEGARRVAELTGTPQQTIMVDSETEVTPELMSTLFRQIDEPFDSASRLAGEYFLGRASIEAGLNSALTGATPGAAMSRLREQRTLNPDLDSLGIEGVLAASFNAPPYSSEDRVNRALVQPADMTLRHEAPLADLELVSRIEPGPGFGKAFTMARRLRSANSRDALFYQFQPPLLGLEERTPFIDTRMAEVSTSIPPVLWGLESKQYDRAPLKEAYRKALNLDPNALAKGAYPGTPQPAWLKRILVPSLKPLVDEGIVRSDYLPWLEKGIAQGRQRAKTEAWQWFVFNCWYQFQIKQTDPFAAV